MTARWECFTWSALESASLARLRGHYVLRPVLRSLIYAKDAAAGRGLR